MVVVRVTANVPENRHVSLDLILPPEVPVGTAELMVEVRTEPEQVFDVRLEPEPPRSAHPERPSDEKLAREFDAFEQLLSELLKTHRGQFVAIHDGQVVAAGNDTVEVAQEACGRFGYQPILVRLVAEEQPVIRMPSVWLSR